MTAFKEILIGGYVLRFWPSDNGWVCGITESMMDALQQQCQWMGLTDEEIALIAVECSLVSPSDHYFAQAIEAKLKEKNT